MTEKNNTMQAINIKAMTPNAPMVDRIKSLAEMTDSIPPD